ncbi:MAG: hypothetical protein LBQ77_04565 [Treponema sp.]|jgi:hypothetical protein|nr:hypothetical protein [Treponema sp.]
MGIIVTVVVLLLGCSNESTLDSLNQAFCLNEEAPVFYACKAIDTTKISFSFSQPVTVKSLSFEPSLDITAVEEGAVVTVSYMERDKAGGERVVADILVEDERGNTLNVLVPFRTLNKTLPNVLITEIRTEYSKPRVEFVEFKPLASGNLGALRLFIASNGRTEPIFEFPPVEVQSGEYIVLHLRKLDERAENEYDFVEETVVKESDSTKGRDFWVESNKELLRKTDAVFFMDQNDNIIDAVVIDAETGGKYQTLIADAVDVCVQQGAWNGDAVPSQGTTATRTISRLPSDADSNSADDWFIAATGKASPGGQNTTEQYHAP